MAIELQSGMLRTKYVSDISYIDTTIVEIDEDGNEIHKPIQIPDKSPGRCDAQDCGRAIRDGEWCFIDTVSDDGSLYCDGCGKCERYARKMEKKRSTTPVITSTKAR